MKIEILIILSFLFFGCTMHSLQLKKLQLKESINRNPNGTTNSDRWDSLNREFSDSEQDCLVMAKKDFDVFCPHFFTSLECQNIWNYTEVYSWVNEKNVNFCTMDIPKDYNLDLAYSWVTKNE